MRVTVIGPDYPLRGGIAHQVYCLKRDLSNRGHTVQVISFSQLYPRLLFPGTTEMDTSASTLDAGGLAILNPLNPLTWHTAYQVVKKFSPDLVIFQWWHTFFAPMVGTLARRLRKAGLKCVLDCHNVYPHEGGRLDLSLLKFAVKPFNSFITHSAKVRNDLLPFALGRPISVSPLPIPSEFAGTGNRNRSGRNILFFGVVRKYKGLDVLLNAMPKVLAEINCKLLVAGEFYDSIDRYRKIITDLDLDKQVIIDNRYVPNEEIPGIFDRVDVMVAPYLDATQSGVAAIARTNALPVIASRSGGLSETVTENVTGLLFPAGDSNALAEQIVSYFQNNLGPVFARNLQAELAEEQTRIGRLVEDLVLDQPHDARQPSPEKRDPLTYTK